MMRLSHLIRRSSTGACAFAHEKRRLDRQGDWHRQRNAVNQEVAHQPRHFTRKDIVMNRLLFAGVFLAVPWGDGHFTSSDAGRPDFVESSKPVAEVVAFRMASAKDKTNPTITVLKPA